MKFRSREDDVFDRIRMNAPSTPEEKARAKRRYDYWMNDETVSKVGKRLDRYVVLGRIRDGLALKRREKR